ncbi:CarD family transcriptional regulator, partial [Metallibacterium sp.]|uniref:CarD family transcriptional regulator n=1 Tax=Metallibacterium sp. TaxID=2940281 RepID=UPI0026076E66
MPDLPTAPAPPTSLLTTPPLPADARQWRRWVRPPGAGLALALCEAARGSDAPLVAITADSAAALTLEHDLAVFAGDLPILALPDWEILPYELFSPHGEIVAQRIATLHRLPGCMRGVLVLPVATLMQRLAPRSYLAQSGLQLARGQKLDLETETRRLQSSGYRRVAQVGDPGEFALRGAVLDIYPSGAPLPYRIELLDDEIDSLRSFDVETQRSLQTLQRIDLLPAREFPLTEEAVRGFRARLRERFPIDVRHCPVYQDLREGSTPAGIEYYLPLFFEATETLFDYLPARAIFVLAEPALDAAERFWQQTEARHAQRAHDIERPILPPAELYLAPQALREQLNRSRRVELCTADAAHAQALDIGAAPQVQAAAHANPAQMLQTLLQGLRGCVLLAADSPGRREMLRELLTTTALNAETLADWPAFLAWRDAQVPVQPAPRLALSVAALSAGFSLPRAGITVLSEQELVGERVRQERTRRRGAARDPEAVLRDLTELSIGAPIVHVDHGVGRYLGLITLDVGGSAGEFLALEYAKGDKLYVP